MKTKVEHDIANLICEHAIKPRKVVSFYYESSSGSYWRKVEPYLLAIKDNGKGNAFFTGYAHPSSERETEQTNDNQGQYLLKKIDLQKFKILDENFNHLKIAYDKIFGELPTIKIICRVTEVDLVAFNNSKPKERRK